MTADPRAVLAQRILARRRLIHFTQAMYPQYQPGWVHVDVCMRLERFYEAVKARKSPRLMLTMPPRIGKSMLASTMFPGWVMGQDPTTTFISTSYNMDLPLAFSRRIRSMVRDSQEYAALFPGTSLSPDSQSAETWETTEGGVFVAAGIGGGLTGKGAEILLIDDPVKNSEEADNQSLHEKHLEWYQSTAYTRLAPGGGVIIIMTRWNFADLSGRLQQLADMDPEADRFEVVEYPAIAEQYEYRHTTTMEMLRSPDALPPDKSQELELLRTPGEVLHPERFTPEMVARIKANLNPRIWSALYQQKPAPDEGLFFRKEYLRSQPALPYITAARMYTAWDFAISTKNSNDYTSLSTVIHDPSAMLYVENCSRFRRDTFGIVEAIIDEAVRVQKRYPVFDYIVGVEDGQIWKAIAPVLARRMRERRVAFSIELLTPLTDKQVRARPLQSLMQQGMVIFLSSIADIADIISELLQFPAGRHDDFVDSLSWAARMSLNHSPPRAQQHMQRPTSWKDRLGSFVQGHIGGFMGD